MTVVALPGGRPTKYTDELAKEICQTISTNSCSIKKMCRDRDHWPEAPTIFSWILKSAEFCEMYSRAKEAQVEAHVDAIMEIADDASDDEDTDKAGNRRINREFVERSKLKIQARTWQAECLKPTKWGKKTLISGADGQALKIETKLTNKDRERKVLSLFANIADRIKSS